MSHTDKLSIVQIAYSPGILGFKMEKNNIKLKISENVFIVSSLFPVKSPKVSPERNSLFLDKIQNGR